MLTFLAASDSMAALGAQVKEHNLTSTCSTQSPGTQSDRVLEAPALLGDGGPSFVPQVGHIPSVKTGTDYLASISVSLSIK